MLGRIVDLHPSRPISGYATAGLPGLKKLKRPNLAIRLFKKGQKRANYQRKFVKIYHEYFGVSVNIVCFVENKLEVALIDTIFFKVQKRPNGQNILFLENCLKKAKWQPCATVLT